MDTQPLLYTVGLFDDRYRAFLETVVEVRPKLHRYCARMTGSVLDGEDVVQESLFEAYRKLDQYDESRPLTPWLFGIAHHRCLDFLRRRETRKNYESAVALPESYSPTLPQALGIGQALERLVMHLPPMERACVLLKDVLDYTLVEIAELVGSTEGGVKSALSRGRSKLAALPASPEPMLVPVPASNGLLLLYAERFNRRDWNGLRELTSADAQLRFPNGFMGRLDDSPYFSKCESAPLPWQMEPGELDGLPLLLRMQQQDGHWTLHSVIRLCFENGRVVRISDYYYCPWVLATAGFVSTGVSSATSQP
jgi:RNA polymerase sigma-70 factor, ECF subfamily